MKRIVRRIVRREELVALARELGVRRDWHEPDEQDVEVEVKGYGFDNAGFWPAEDCSGIKPEKYVVVKQGKKAVACVNLATLFAWAAEPRGEGAGE